MEKRLLIVILISVLAGGSIFSNTVKAQNADKPNIIFIMADDVGAECLQGYGGQSYQTPNLDKLADNGIRFTNAFTTPLCTPTRVQVMSGQYPFRNGWTGGIWNQPEDKQFLDPQLFNFARMLKNEGYATAVAGKWQLARFENQPDHPRDIGFDEYCLWTWRYTNDLPEYVNMEGAGKPARFWNPGIWRNGSIMKDVKGKYGPDIYTDFLLDFIDKHLTQPFFIYYPMALAHFPFVAVPGTEEGGTKQENFNHMIKYMDMLVGKFVKQLEDLGISDNTLVIFTGDNGTDRNMTSKVNGKVLQGGKGNLNDAGTRVPFILKWPAVAEEGKVVDDLVDLSDVLPTSITFCFALIEKLF